MSLYRFALAIAYRVLDARPQLSMTFTISFQVVISSHRFHCGCKIGARISTGRGGEGEVTGCCLISTDDNVIEKELSFCRGRG